MESCGVRRSTKSLFESYLINRLQKVIVNETYSNAIIVNTRVPPEIILRPLLFIIYINDLFYSLPVNSISFYTDDTVTLSSVLSWALAREKMNNYL